MTATTGYNAQDAADQRKQIVKQIERCESFLQLCDRLDKIFPHLPMERRIIVQEGRQAFVDRLDDWRNALKTWDEMMPIFERMKNEGETLIGKAYLLKLGDKFESYCNTTKLEQTARKNFERMIQYYFSEDETLRDFFKSSEYEKK